ncbi:MAG TPA: DNA-binding response regulator [Sutterella sp.]|nr:DNA-binding response regulator [Sutterella sp.]
MANNVPLVRIVDDDQGFRNSLAFLLEGEGWEVKTYRDGSLFLASNDFERPGCIILDVRMPNMSGIGLQTHLNKMGIDLPIIFLSGHGDIDMAVHTTKMGAVDFLQKPVNEERLFKVVREVIEAYMEKQKKNADVIAFKERLATLTQREREVVNLISLGKSNKEVGDALGISEKTAQVHRGSAYRKLEIHNATEIARLLMRAKEDPSLEEENDN